MTSQSNLSFPIQIFLKAIGSVCGLFLFAILVPQYLSEFMILGLSSGKTIIVVLLIPVLFFSLWFVYASPQKRLLIGVVASLLAGIFSFFVGLFWEFGIDENSYLMIIFICLFLYFGFLASGTMFQLIWKEEKCEDDRKWMSLGVALLLALLGIIQLISQSLAILQYVIGCVYLVVPITWKYFSLPIFTPRSSISQEQLRSSRLDLFGVLLELFLIWIIFNFSAFLKKAPLGWGLIGVALGFFIYFWTDSHHNIPIGVYLAVGLLGLYTIMIMDLKWTESGLFLFGAGLLLGLTVADLYRIATHFSLDRRIGFQGWQFWGVLLCATSAALISEFNYLLREYLEFFWLGYIIIGILMGLSLITTYSARGLAKFASKIPSRGTLERYSMASSMIKSIKITSLSLMVVMPIFIIAFIPTTNLYIQISLDSTYYSVDGDPITSLSIPARSAKILLRTPAPKGIAHAESIRINKSVRLGAYFYGLDKMPVKDAISWIGQNLDVYSLSMCGTSNTSFTPADILSIKDLNPMIKFYYMAFATTLFEDMCIDSFYTNNTWGDSHYPTMKFNATMNNWTLKLKDGTEALGIRREKNNDSAHLMDLGQSAWADYFGWIYGDRATKYHADGIACDEVMWRGYWDTKIDQLANYSTLDEIIATCYSWVNRVDQRLGEQGKEFITQAFWDQAQLYQDGVWGETAFMSSRKQYGDRVDDRNKTVWYEGMTWEGVVENLYNQGIRNRSYIWAAFYDRYNQESLEYAIATYLMGKPNNCLSLGFHPQPVYDGGYPANLAGYSIKTVGEELTRNSKYFDLELGDALGQMELKYSNGNPYYQREFENGVVIVNPFHATLTGFY